MASVSCVAKKQRSFPILKDFTLLHRHTTGVSSPDQDLGLNLLGLSRGFSQTDWFCSADVLHMSRLSLMFIVVEIQFMTTLTLNTTAAQSRGEVGVDGHLIM